MAFTFGRGGVMNALYISFLQGKRVGYYPLDMVGSEIKNRRIAMSYKNQFELFINKVIKSNKITSKRKVTK